MQRNVWTRACLSNGCVEVKWMTACSSGSCVEVAHDGDRVLVRDSKLGLESPVLSFSPVWWQTMLKIIRGGKTPAVVWMDEDGSATWRKSSDPGVELHFDAEEMAEFVEGVKAGTFDPQDVSSG